MSYEYTRCGHLDRIGDLEPDEAYWLCPRYENRTRWKLAFDGEGESP